MREDERNEPTPPRCSRHPTEQPWLPLPPQQLAGLILPLPEPWFPPGEEDVSATPATRLGPRFVEAMGWALELHATQLRKGTAVPYAAHLLAVAALVLEHGGDEEEAIAALLHDAPEDQGGAPTLAEVGRRFGARVESIVAACSDTFEEPKPLWQARKEAHIEHMRRAEASTRLIALADKVHNLHAILRDHARLGDVIWERFRVRDPARHAWYYRGMLEALTEGAASEPRLLPLLEMLASGVAELEAIAARAPDAGRGPR